MSKQTSSLFIKYFKDFFIIMLSFIVIITIILSYFIYSYMVSDKNSYRIKATEQANQILSDLLDDCTGIFASVSADADINNFKNTDVRGLSEMERYTKTLRIKNDLLNKLAANDYISSISLCSFEQGFVLSHQLFKMTNDFTEYVWYNDNLITDNTLLPYSTAIVSSESSNTESIILYKALEVSDPENCICIITINATDLKAGITKTFYDNGCSVLMWDNRTDTPLINIGLDENQLHEIHKNSLNNKEPSFFNNNQSIRLFQLNDYNWDCVYVYDNSNLNKEFIQTICLIMPLSFAILIIIAILLSYIRAKKAYLPINKMVSALSNYKSNIEVQDIATNYQYTEMNYIAEVLMSNIHDKNKLQTELMKNLQQLNDANKYALEVQIQPHFIFNTLEIVYLQAYELFGDNNIISEMIYNLSDILRVTLRNDNKFIPINTEIDYIKKYMYIQNVRFDNLFETTYEIDEKSEELLTPKLILQPIVENSIVHGIIPAERKCIIKVSNRVEKDKVVFVIEDTGVGMSEERLLQIRETMDDASSLPKKNIGIANVNMRLKLLFGDEFGCNIVHSGSDGTKIEISIPVITS